MNQCKIYLISFVLKTNIYISKQLKILKTYKCVMLKKKRTANYLSNFFNALNNDFSCGVIKKKIKINKTVQH